MFTCTPVGIKLLSYFTDIESVETQKLLRSLKMVLKSHTALTPSSDRKGYYSSPSALKCAADAARIRSFSPTMDQVTRFNVKAVTRSDEPTEIIS